MHPTKRRVCLSVLAKGGEEDRSPEEGDRPLGRCSFRLDGTYRSLGGGVRKGSVSLQAFGLCHQSLQQPDGNGIVRPAAGADARPVSVVCFVRHAYMVME